jgi:hypothetical protein
MESLEGYERLITWTPLPDATGWMICEKCDNLPRIMEDDMSIAARCRCGKEVGFLKVLGGDNLRAAWNAMAVRK